MFGSTWSDEKREQMKERMSGENNPRYGVTLSDETKAKLSEALTGRIISEETRQKTSETMTGKKNLIQCVRNCQKVAKADYYQRLRKMTGSANPLSKKVEQYDLQDNLIKVHDSMSDAARECKTYHSSISACCNGKKETSGGFKWKFQEVLA
jgi:group I intron endonuclease